MAEKTKKETKVVADMPEEKVEKPKENAMRYGYVLARNSISNRSQHPVTVNGKSWLVPVGVPVDLPEYVAKVLDEAIAAKERVYKMIEKAQKKANAL